MIHHVLMMHHEENSTEIALLKKFDEVESPNPAIRGRARTAMVAIIRTHPDAGYRSEACFALHRSIASTNGLVDDEDIEKALIEALRDPSLMVAEGAGEALAEMQSPPLEAIPGLLENLKRLSGGSAHALAKISPTSMTFIPRVLRLLKDENPGIRYTVIEVFAGIPSSLLDQQVVKAIHEAVHDEDQRVRDKANTILKNLAKLTPNGPGQSLVDEPRFMTPEEVDKLPEAIKVVHEPKTVLATLTGKSGRRAKYTWWYKTSVSAT
jgi:HEAT repeat protein